MLSKNYLYNTSIDELDLTIDVSTVLHNHHIDTIDKLNEIIANDKDYLLKLFNYDQKQYKEILTLVTREKSSDFNETSSERYLSSYNFSKRALDVFRRGNIKTISDLQNYSLAEIKSWRNVGRQTLKEIIDFLSIQSKQAFQVIPSNLVFSQDKSVVNIFSIKKELDEYTFSKRTLNIFKLKGIKTIDDLKRYSIFDIKRWRNIGKKTLNEIIDFLSSIPEEISVSNFLTICIIDNEFIKFYQLALDDYRQLKTMGFCTIGSLMEWIKLKKEVSYLEIKNINVFIYEKKLDKQNIFKISQELNNIFNSFYEISGDHIFYLLSKIVVYIAKNNINFRQLNLENYAFINEVLKTEKFYEEVYKKTFLIISSSPFGISQEIIRSKLPYFLQASDIEKCLRDLEKQNIVLRNKNFDYEIILPSIKKYISELDDKKLKDILTKRIIQGQTLEEISENYTITRERIRQIVDKNINMKLKNLQFEEDRYSDIYKKYKFTREQAKLIFGEITSNYLLVRYDSGTKDLEEILEDISVPPIIRKRIRSKIIYADCIHLGKEYVKKNRTDLLHYYFRHYCKKEVDVNDFIRNFAMFWGKLGLGKELYEIEERTFSNKLIRMPNILYKYPRSFRFYDFEQYDFTNLLDTLTLEQYENVMLSTAKFIRDYPRLMKKYDINDEYELHSLLRHLLEDKNNYITFHRMPSIEFGHADIESQVVSLLEENSPISSNELALLYEKKYGNYFKTVVGTYFKCIGKYLYKGVYTINCPKLTENEFNYLKKCLTDDFYTIAYVRDLFKKKFSDLTHINPFTLKDLGFIVNENHIVNKKYGSAMLYFKYLLTRNTTCCYEDIIPEIRRLQNFNTVLNSLLDSYDLLEFAKKQYITFEKIAAFGITKDDFYDFCAQVNNLVLPNYFSFNHVKNLMFKHKIFDLGFDDWFYSCLLTRNYTLFSSQKIGGTIIFSKGNNDITWLTLLESIIPDNGIDIYRLIDYLHDEFSIKVTKTDIMARIADSDLYYDKIMEKVYLNYEDYYEEI